MALQLLNMETFAGGNGLLNSSTVGDFDFDGCSGTGLIRPWGPKLSATPGIGHSIIWNANTSGTPTVCWFDVATTPTTGKFFTFAIHPRTYQPGGDSHRLLTLDDNGSDASFGISVNQSGTEITFSAGGINKSDIGAAIITGSNPVLGINQWIYVIVAVHRNSHGSKRNSMKLWAVTDPASVDPDAPNLTLTDFRGGDIKRATFDNVHSGGVRPRGLMGGFSQYDFDYDNDDVVWPDFVNPVADYKTWFIDTVNGNNVNDGTADDRAWSDFSIWRDIQNIVPVAATTTGGGDEMIIDAPSESPIVLEESQTLRFVGTHVYPADGRDHIHITNRLRLDNAEAVEESGPVYRWPVTAGSNGAMFEDGLLMQHMKLNDFDDQAALLTAMEALPGRFYVDAAGENVFVHPIGSTDPTTDGKRYEIGRTHQLDLSGGHILIDGGGFKVDGSHVQAHDTGTSTTVSYTLRYGALSGVSDIEAYTTGGMNHTEGAVAGVAGQTIIMRGSSRDGQHNLPVGNTQTTMVSYDDSKTHATGAGATWSGGEVTLTYPNHRITEVGHRVAIQNATPSGYNGVYAVTEIVDANTLKFALASDPGGATSAIRVSAEFEHEYRKECLASTAKPLDPAGAKTFASLISHNSPVVMKVVDSDLSGGSIGADIWALELLVTGSHIRRPDISGAINPDLGSRLIKSSRSDGLPASQFGSLSYGRVEFCGVWFGEPAAMQRQAGDYLFTHCVFDLRGGGGTAFWDRWGGFDLEITDSVFLWDENHATALINALDTSDTVLSNRNVWIGLPANVLTAFDGGSRNFAYWQDTLGHDADSFVYDAMTGGNVAAVWELMKTYCASETQITETQAKAILRAALGGGGRLDRIAQRSQRTARI
jgi:hypothetical protein